MVGMSCSGSVPDVNVHVLLNVNVPGDRCKA